MKREPWHILPGDLGHAICILDPLIIIFDRILELHSTIPALTEKRLFQLQFFLTDAALVLWEVSRELLHAFDDRMVEEGAMWNIAGFTFVQWQSLVVPFPCRRFAVLYVLPAPDQREVFFIASPLANRYRKVVHRIQRAARYGKVFESWDQYSWKTALMQGKDSGQTYP